MVAAAAVPDAELLASLDAVVDLDAALGTGHRLQETRVQDPRLLLVFLYLVPAIPSVLGYFLLPLQLGARELALPALSRCSLRLYGLGTVLVLASLFTAPVMIEVVGAALIALLSAGTV